MFKAVISGSGYYQPSAREVSRVLPVCFYWKISKYDKGIYEQGKPDDIFDRPQKPLTLSFINKIKYFSYSIDSRDFDLMEFHGGLQTFGEKYGLEQGKIMRLKLCCEELVYEMLKGCYRKDEPPLLQFSVSYAEATRNTDISLTCGGKAYNPFDQAADDDLHLGVTILKRVALSCRHSFADGQNRISLQL